MAYASDPLVFIQEAVMPDEIHQNDTFTASYEIKNELSTGSLPLTVSIIPNQGYITRNAGGTCTSSLAAKKSCTLIFDISPSEDTQTGTSEQILSISYDSRLGPLTSDMTFEVTPPAMVYVTDNRWNTVFACKILKNTDELGQLSDCQNAVVQTQQKATVFDLPSDIAFVTINDVTYAYIVNLDTEVTQCTVVNNQLINCALTELSSYFSMTINHSDNWYAYYGAMDQIFKCDINPDNGDLESCQDAGTGHIFTNTVADVLFQTFNNTRYAFIAHGDNAYAGKGTFMRCPVDVSGDISSDCVTWTGFGRMSGITYASLDDSQYFYLMSGGEIAICEVDDNGDIVGSCSNQQFDGYSLVGTMMTNTIDGIPYVYFPAGESVFQCTIGDKGVLNCEDSGADQIDYPMGVTLF
ncbi:MAG: hypothetical protein ABSF18_04325 [Gammaproteobacteria bacterium]